MIDGLRAYVEAENLSFRGLDYEESKKQQEALYAQFDEAWKLIGDNIGCLWW